MDDELYGTENGPYFIIQVRMTLRISLGKCLSHVFHHMLTEEESHLFVSSLEEYRVMWKVQGEKFWVRFVTALRNEAQFQQEFLPHDIDWVFIELLKRLTADSFNPIEELIQQLCILISNKKNDPQSTGDAAASANLDAAMTAVLGSSHANSKQLRAHLRLSLRCAGTVVRLLDIWRLALQGESRLPVPRKWLLQSCTVVLPYEVFLRSRWGNQLPNVLGIQLSQLGWWSVQASPSSALQPHIVQRSRVTDWMQHTAEWASRLVPLEPLDQQCEVKSFRSRLESQCGAEARWLLLELGLMPPLSSRFLGAVGSSLQLPEEASTCVWAAACQEVLSTQFCFLQQSQHYELEIHRHTGDFIGILKRWEKTMQELCCMVQRVRNDYIGAPHCSALAQSATEILLEPVVLLSLSACPANLHTWLAVALIEVHKFEIDSLKLRHWPLPGKLEEPARELLSIVSYCKERLLLALAILTKHVTDFTDPVTDDNLFLLLMERAVLPATAGLELVCSGQAREKLAEIEQQAWTQQRSLDGCLSVPLASYNVADTQASVYHSSYWHLAHWLDMAAVLEPWPKVAIMSLELTELVQHVRRNVVPRADYPPAYKIKNMDHFEFAFANGWFRESQSGCFIDISKEAPHWLSQCHKLLLSLAQLGQVTNAAAEALIKKVNLDTVGELATKFTSDKCSELTLAQQALLYSCMYTQLRQASLGLEQEQDSLLWWLVRLSGEVVMREQLVRLVAVVSLHSQECPLLVAKSENKLALRSPAVLLKELRAVSRGSTRDLKWLKRQMPEAWQEPFNHDEPEPDLEEKKLSQVLSSLEARHGRLLVTAVTESLRQLDKCDFHVELQYLMPYYLSVLRSLATADSKQAALEVAALLHNLLHYYELQMHSWRIGKYRRPAHLARSNYFQNVYELARDVDCKLTNSVFLGQHCMQRAMIALHANVGCGGRNLDGLPGFLDIAEGMQQWPNNSASVPSQPIEAAVLMRLAWQNVCLPHCVAMLGACQHTWVDPVAKEAEIAEVLYASQLMMRLECQTLAELTRTPGNTVLLQRTNNDFNHFTDKLQGLMLWRRDFLSRVFHHDKQLQECASTGRTLIREQLTLIRKLRGGIDSVHLINFPSSGHPTMDQILRQFAANKMQEVEKAVTDPGVYITRESELRAKLEQALSLDSGAPRKSQGLRHGTTCRQESTPAVNNSTQAEQVSSAVPRKCRKCNNTETVNGTFLPCPSCDADNYPDRNFFCSAQCRRLWWEMEHYADHLEYRLGISSFCAN